MGVLRPAGGFAEAMLEAGGWPEVAEEALYDRAQQYTRVLHQVTEVRETCQQQQYEIFRGGVWSGGAAGAADGQLGRNIDQLAQLQSNLATVITWQRRVAGSIEQAKSDIDDNVAAAQRRIDSIERDHQLKPDERTAAINSVVSTTRAANVSVVENIAEEIRESRDWKPPKQALQDLLNQKAPPPEPTARDPLLGDRDRSRSGRNWGQGAPDSAPTPPTGTAPPAAAAPPTTAPSATPAPAAATGEPATAPAAAKPLNSSPSASPTGAGARAPGMPSAPAAPAPPAAPASGPGMAPASAAGVPAAPKGSGSRGAAAGSSSGPAAPVGQSSSGSSHGVRPASATPQAAEAATHLDDPGPRPKVAGGQSDAGAGVPVSAARAERDAAAAAARRGQADPLVLARRIAAALNVARTGTPHLKFFWVTAMTTTGDIVVANNYGLAYIPGDVQLPERVHMASADKSIPPATRASWATYPMSALQGWAEHRNAKLRAVIGTEEQFKDSDPGVSMIVLKPDDIPASGEMAGRPRLEVVDRQAAKRLSATPDERLATLLPAAPAAPPADRRSRLWLDTMRPLSSRATGRSAAHLRAFRGYAAHEQEMLLVQAKAIAEPAAQRAALADWMYWRHLAGLLDAAAAQPAQP